MEIDANGTLPVFDDYQKRRLRNVRRPFSSLGRTFDFVEGARLVSRVRRIFKLIADGRRRPNYVWRAAFPPIRYSRPIRTFRNERSVFYSRFDRLRLRGRLSLRYDFDGDSRPIWWGDVKYTKRVNVNIVVVYVFENRVVNRVYTYTSRNTSYRGEIDVLSPLLA